MCQEAKSENNRRLRRRCRIAVGLCLLTYSVCSQTALRVENASFRLALSGVAGAAFFAELVSVGILITRLRDEFQRMLLLRSFLWGTLVTMAFATIWGFMEVHGGSEIPHINLLWVPIALICITAGAKLLIFRKYRPESD